MGRRMDIVLGVEAEDSRRLDRSRLTLVLINDSPFTLSFAFSTPADGNWILRHRGRLEPDMSLDLEITDRGRISDWREFRFQCLVIGEEKMAEQPIPPVDVTGSIDPDSVCREQSYRSPVYSSGALMEIPLVKDGVPVDHNCPDPVKLKMAMGGAPRSMMRELLSKYASDSATREAKNKKGSIGGLTRILPTQEIDLHIHSLLDNTAGMDNTAMLQLQLDHVRRTLSEHQRRIGQKIVFIHGKGEGVLRSALRSLLKREYPHYEVQDASFRKYGFGATLVIIHSSRK